MKRWMLAVLLAGLVLPGMAQDAMRADANGAAEAEIKKLELDLAQMIVHNGWDQYAAALMDDYLASDRNGAVQDKGATLAGLRSGQEKILELDPEELRVRVYGDTAIVTGHFTLVQRRNGRVDTFFARQTNVFVNL